MSAETNLIVRAAVADAVRGLRQIKDEIVGVRSESAQATAAQETQAGKNVASTVKQRDALLALAREYGLVADAAKRGSVEQQIAAGKGAEATERANALIRETNTQTTKVHGSMNLLGKTMGIVFGGAIAAKGLSDIVDVAKEAQVSQSLLANTMKQAGQDYAANRKQIEGNIDAEARLAGIQRVDLRTSFQTLDRVIVTSQGARGAVTKATQAMGVASDIARARHISLAAATRLVSLVELGRVSQLRRIGIALPQITTAQDKLRDSHAHVTAEVMRQAKAWDQQQTAISGVAALHKAYAGSAEAYGKTAGGAVDRLRVAWQDFGIYIGNKLLPIIQSASSWLADELDKLNQSEKAHRLLHDATEMVVAAYHELVPWIKLAVEVVKDVVGWFDKHRTVAEFLAGTILSIVAAYKIYAETVKVATALQAAFDLVMEANPIGLVVTALAALTVGIILAYKHSATFREIVKEIGKIGADAFDFLRRHWQLVLAAFGPLGLIAGQVISHFHAIVDAIRHPIAAIEGAWQALFLWLEKRAIEVALKIVEPFSHLPGWLGGGWARSMKSNLQSALDGLQSPAASAGKAVGTALGGNIQAALQPYMAAIGAQIGGVSLTGGARVPGAAGNPKAGGQAAGTQFGLVTAARSLGVGSGGVYATGGGHSGIARPGTMLDCSGYTYQVYTQNGFKDFPGTSETQWATHSGPNWTSQIVPRNAVEPGDLIFMVGSPEYPSPGHVGIVVAGHGNSATIMQYYSTGHPPDTISLSSVRDFVGAKRYYLVKKADKATTAKTKPPATATPAPSDLASTAVDTAPPSFVTAAAGKAADDAAAKAAAAAAKKRQEAAKAAATAASRRAALRTGAATVEEGVAALKAQIDTFPKDVRAPLERQAAAISKSLGGILTPADLANAKRHLTQLKDEVRKALAAAKAEVTAAKSVFERQWQAFASAADAAFDQVTAKVIATHRITVQMGGYSFQYGQGDLTPAAQQLADLQAATAQKQRDDAIRQAQTGLSAAQAALAAGAATGGDMQQLQQAVADAQSQLDQAQLDQRESDLQTQADAEQKAADTQFQTWQDGYQATRDAQKSALDAQLAQLQTALENQKLTWAQAMDDITALLAKGGADSATAFWAAFTAAQTLVTAGGGTSVVASGQTALAGLGKAQGSLPGAGSDPGQGTSPNDRGGVLGATTQGFVWGGIVWTRSDKQAFMHWLTQHGATYSTWAANHPAAAATFLAKGGLITAPTLAMMGETPGSREAVMPLDDPRAMRAIGQAIAQAAGGTAGGVTVVFPNAIVPGRDRDAARRLARMTAPEIRRQISYKSPV